MSIYVSTHRAPVAPKTAEVSQTLCERTERVRDAAHALHDAAKVVKRVGVANCVNGAVTLGGGLYCTASGLWNGSLTTAFLGAAMTATGAKTIIDIFRTNKESGTLAELLNDADASADMVRVLVEADQKSLDIVDANVKSVKAAVISLNGKMDEIQAIAKDATINIQGLKKKADKEFASAQTYYNEAEKIFQKSQKKIEKANRIFAETITGFAEILAIAKSSEGDMEERLELFAKKAKQLASNCKKGQIALEEGNSLITKGLEKMDKARAKQEAGVQLVGEAIGAAKASQEMTQQLAEKDEESLQHVATIQKECDTLKERNQDKKLVLDTMKQKLEEAKNQDTAWGTKSTFFGFVGASAAAPVAAAFIPAIPFAAPIVAGWAAGTVFHNRQKLSDKAYNFLFSPRDKVPGDFAPLHYQKTKDAILFSHDLISTGWRKWFDGERRGSRTEGDIQINLGISNFPCRFHLGKDEPISIPDLLELQKAMVDAVTLGFLPKEKCLAILDSLTTPHERLGGRALVAKGSPFFREVYRLCL